MTTFAIIPNVEKLTKILAPIAVEILFLKKKIATESGK